MAELALKVTALTKQFGGLAAVNDVSLQVARGTLHAVIGPNGAGKSTLIHLLSGDLSPTSGSVALNGSDITHLAPDQRSRAGIGRSYQKTNIFPAFSVLENCRLAAQSREPHAFNLFRSAASYLSISQAANEALDAVGLQHRARIKAGFLSHGEQRQLEIAMSLATKPQVLLLDEPLAGMGAQESTKMVTLLQKLIKNHAVLLVEHDMDAVFALADVLTVMVNGRVLESGTPEQIRNSAQVQRAYLGNEEAEHG
ncbi:ABC transporter ATP-binding protein [Candidatus Aalborgicola defluviihabitans]|mgnify:CR=1 FL=1|uniref:ABC transporter ATP-binding protein n=1 Tax=Candidatus Aalborgicola defluviihabitans TaxID=3386187 RepID=UPI001D5B5186|nr:ABC transporter ATP-binding protein [Burkholderiales bacterium]MBK6567241.1 ABC transporter ATP-binding protein [Burkholderiales bacterium]MBK7282712.1 ABC transporter ATP-binding protein [Burkholderiales bacterium]MBK7314681.1 ABC transporter ATP-binding protein [Burkholderiales bacterium]MBL0245435.1 ABC transporter ATP-binding protein [Rhodoferax sp.]